MGDSLSRFDEDNIQPGAEIVMGFDISIVNSETDNIISYKNLSKLHRDKLQKLLTDRKSRFWKTYRNSMLGGITRMTIQDIMFSKDRLQLKAKITRVQNAANNKVMHLRKQISDAAWNISNDSIPIDKKASKHLTIRMMMQVFQYMFSSTTMTKEMNTMIS